MNMDDEYKLLIGAYYGIKYLDQYELKEYLLNDIRKIINEFINNNKNKDYDFKKMEEVYEKELTKRTKLQDALLLLQDINGPLEVSLIIRKLLKEEK
jgi:hypothetical protein